MEALNKALNKEIEIKENISTADIFKIIQDVSAEHCNALGLGMDVLGGKGIIWVVIRQYVELERPLNKGEKIKVSTWPGLTRHMMFPRYCVFRDMAGEVILRGSAIWTLVDVESRRMVSPEKYGLSLEGIVTGDEIRLPSAVKKAECSESAEFTVPKEYLDSNNHMNNTRYYDMSEHCLGDKVRGMHIKEALTEFISEARLGENIHLSWGTEAEDRIYVKGENDGPVFKMSLRYF